jgi:glycerol kinase
VRYDDDDVASSTTGEEEEEGAVVAYDDETSVGRRELADATCYRIITFIEGFLVFFGFFCRSLKGRRKRTDGDLIPGARVELSRIVRDTEKKKSNQTMTSIIPPKKSAHECKVCVNRSILHSLLADDVPSSSSTKNLLVGAIDQGTSSSRFLLVASNGRILSTAQIEFDQIFPSNDCGNDDYATAGSSRAGWHEHDPFDVWDSVSTCISRTVEELALLGLDLTTSSSCGATTTTTTTTTTSEVDNGRSNVRIVSVGITNQRETTVCWNDRTGRVYHNAIVWDDTRTASVAESIIAENAKQIKKMTKTTTTDAGDDDDDAHEGGGRRRNDGMDALRCKTGLPIASYFSGTKVRWLIDNVTKLRYDLLSETERHHVRFGTVDTWLLYMLTGYQRSVMEMEGNERLAHEGGEYKTDVTNASRWLFMNLDTLDWDEGLVAAVCGSGKGGGRGGDATTTTIPMATALPKIVPSSDGTIGTVRGIPCPNMPNNTLALKNVVIGSILGDQQAALFGQSCFRPGEAKCTYGEER